MILSSDPAEALTACVYSICSVSSLFQQEIGHSNHTVHRCPQFMADGGQEVTLGLIGQLCILGGVQQCFGLFVQFFLVDSSFLTASLSCSARFASEIFVAAIDAIARLPFFPFHLRHTRLVSNTVSSDKRAASCCKRGPDDVHTAVRPDSRLRRQSKP